MGQQRQAKFSRSGAYTVKAAETRSQRVSSTGSNGRVVAQPSSTDKRLAAAVKARKS